MTEIVFGDSACGCLKMAQHYGDGNFHSGAIGVIIEHSDGSRPTQEEIQAARREAEERERIAWEKAVPMGGNAADVYAFPLGLSIGDISENIPGEKRLQVLRRLYDIYRSGDEDPIFTKEEMKRANDTLQVVCGRILAGERVVSGIAISRTSFAECIGL